MPKVKIKIYSLKRHRMAKAVVTMLKEKFPKQLVKGLNDCGENVNTYELKIEVEDDRPAVVMRQIAELIRDFVPKNDYVFVEDFDLKLHTAFRFGSVRVLAVEVWGYYNFLDYLNPFRHA